ncbi:cadmium-translocating P-type ATPase [Pseudolabrys taiwanensis]|uniref:P-type Zn(2+) transporter n=1 Tax=Pseudolabrys taiwanensis TaxID=331696 RepID=A0A346A4T6_9HYPH|nr:heavy metal translocating P-type ATPase [Pseudolabrys taiwanensis]AXK84183.1 cadmium-translocating P-type ATPase [Pseudolabrys taiwanensis]
MQRLVRPGLAVLVAAGLALGVAAWLGGPAGWADAIWTAVTLPVLLVLVVEIVASLRRGDVGLDIVAALSMSAALLVGEALAAAIVALMYAGGQYLEAFAERRARRDMTALLSRVPRTALRHRDGALEEVALDLIMPGDRLLLRRGDVVPVDGVVASGVAVLDQSALTGEALPVKRAAGEAVLSGSTNAGDAFDLTAEHRAAESTYAGVVRLVEAAQRSRAPMARLADRYALMFLGITVALAAAAWWLSSDPIRAVAVLVVATPCPLILAVPVALVSGLSRAAKLGILIKGGKAIENLARVRALVIDKTGTLTVGEARIVSMRAVAGLSEDALLRFAASLDQASKHIIGQTLVAEAQRRGLSLAVPAEVVETPGEGLVGLVDGHSVIVGGLHFVASKTADGGTALLPRDRQPGALAVAVAVDGKLAGVIVLADKLRAGTEQLLSALRALDIERIVLATGDRHDVARFISAGLSLDQVRSELTPDQKILVVLSERKNGPVMMIGDGVNDAPALAAADVGVAMGAKGAAASAEAADVVLLVDQLDRVLPAIKIARRSRAIALQSVAAGMGLSVLAMVAAALGYLVPVEGALLQEAIDVAVIFNALRALRG